MNVTYCSGRQEDCPRLAEFVYIASDGVAQFLFYDLILGNTPVQIAATYLSGDRDHHTF